MELNLARLYAPDGSCKLCGAPRPDSTGPRVHEADTDCPGVVFDSPLVYVASWMDDDADWHETAGETKETLLAALEKEEVAGVAPRHGLVVDSVRREVAWGEECWQVVEDVNLGLAALRDARAARLKAARVEERAAGASERVGAKLKALRSEAGFYTEAGLRRKVADLLEDFRQAMRGSETADTRFRKLVSEVAPEWTKYVTEPRE